MFANKCMYIFFVFLPICVNKSTVNLQFQSHRREVNKISPYVFVLFELQAHSEFEDVLRIY